MCELYSLDQANDLKEVESYCSWMYNKMGRPHNFSATVSNTDYEINQCAEKVFLSIETKNVYMHIAQRYTQIQHNRFGCSIRSFVALLGCMLQYLIILLEEKLCRRNIIQGIQESLEILNNLYRKSAIAIDNTLDLTIETKTGEHLLSKINKYIIHHLQGTADESADAYSKKYLKNCFKRLCHYDGTNMSETLWLLVRNFLMLTTDDDTLTNSHLDIDINNPIKQIKAILSQTFNIHGTSELSLRIIHFKEAIKNMAIIVCTQPCSEGGKEFSIYSGVLANIKPNTAAVLNKFVGLRNCLMFDCSIGNAEIVSYSAIECTSLEDYHWNSRIITKMKESQVNCIILSGTCDQSLLGELQQNMGISVIENVPQKSLEILSSIMDVDVIVDIETKFTICQLLINVLPLTALDHLLLCSIQIPKWMEIFGVTYVNLKTVLVRHPSINIAQAMFESFKHNLRRIENALSMGFYLHGGGSLEATFAKVLRARANDKIINNIDNEPTEQKCRTMLQITKALELYYFHLHSNIFEYEKEENFAQLEKYDDLESKIGGVEVMSQCLTALFSTDLLIYSDTDLNNSLAI